MCFIQHLTDQASRPEPRAARIYLTFPNRGADQKNVSDIHTGYGQHQRRQKEQGKADEWKHLHFRRATEGSAWRKARVSHARRFPLHRWPGIDPPCAACNTVISVWASLRLTCGFNLPSTVKGRRVRLLDIPSSPFFLDQTRERQVAFHLQSFIEPVEIRWSDAYDGRRPAIHADLLAQDLKIASRSSSARNRIAQHHHTRVVFVFSLAGLKQPSGHRLYA